MKDDRELVHMVKVFCDDASHPTKVVIVARLALNAGGVAYVYRSRDGQQVQVDEGFYSDSDAFGTSRTGPKVWGEVGRQRMALRCRLCGLEAQLREKTAQQLLEGFASAGVSRVRLRELAANL